MGLYDDWNNIAQEERAQQEHEKFWSEYFDAEKDIYKQILTNIEKPYAGTLAELADGFNMDPVYFTGFMDGINTSLKSETKVESLKLSSKLNLDVDLKKLYFNMLNAKAEWLYNLSEWDGLLTLDERKQITKEYRSSKMFIKESTVGRNDPCPCGSGKKYKKCCAQN